MKIQLTSKKQAAEMKAASIEPEREMEEDSNWPTSAEEAANVERLLETPPAINAEAAKEAKDIAAHLHFNG
jgi:hypothetical protein